MSKKTQQMIEKLDKNDKINALWLAMNGQPQNLTYKLSEIKSYVEYIKALIDPSKIKKIKGKKDTKQLGTNVALSPEFFAKYSAKVSQMSKVTYLVENEMIDLINRIKEGQDNENILTLTENQYNFIFSLGGSNLDDFVNSLNLPILKRIRKDDKKIESFLVKSQKDTYFNDRYEISAIFEPNFKRKKLSEKNGWKKKTLVHGTTNKSLLQILDGGFKTASQLRKESADFSYAGSMYGDAIYFAKPEQISKPIYYMDREATTTYIIVADVYYKEFQEVSASSNQYKYTGENMVCARDAGRYGRDEFMALPSQIDIRFVLEVSPKKKNG